VKALRFRKEKEKKLLTRGSFILAKGKKGEGRPTPEGGFYVFGKGREQEAYLHPINGGARGSLLGEKKDCSHSLRKGGGGKQKKKKKNSSRAGERGGGGGEKLLDLFLYGAEERSRVFLQFILQDKKKKDRGQFVFGKGGREEKGALGGKVFVC